MAAEALPESQSPKLGPQGLSADPGPLLRALCGVLRRKRCPPYPLAHPLVPALASTTIISPPSLPPCQPVPSWLSTANTRPRVQSSSELCKGGVAPHPGGSPSLFSCSFQGRLPHPPSLPRLISATPPLPQPQGPPTLPHQTQDICTCCACYLDAHLPPLLLGQLLLSSLT